VEGLLRDAMQLGVTHVGGLDPTLVDGDMEKSLQSETLFTPLKKPLEAEKAGN
jgi:hypothetical protein